MGSTDAGTPAAGDGQPPPEPTPRRGLRDSALGKLLLLGLVLGAAFVSTRACGAGGDVTSEEAKEIAIEHASFEPCADDKCKVAQFVQRGIPPRPFWIVGLAERLDDQGQPTRTESFLIDAVTGEVSRA